MKAIIKDTSELDASGVQTVSFDIVDNDGKVLVSQAISGDVEALAELIKTQVKEYNLKCKSEKRLKVGDIIEI